MATRVWLVTGAASGLGKAVTERVLQNGEIVVATDILLDGLDDLKAKYPESQLLVRRMDVRDITQITSTLYTAKHLFKRIDIVFNNAGVVLAGELEGTPVSAGQNLLDVNFWGSLQVTLEAVKFFREENPNSGPIGGRILVTSSRTAITTSPGMGYYSAATRAIEGITEALTLELDPMWNIKITLMEVGDFRTSIFDTAETYPVHPAYTKPSLSGHKVREWLNTVPESLQGDPVKAAQQIYRVANLPDPPIRLAIGKDAIESIRKSVNAMLDELDKYEDWSEDLVL
ncbi:hypothetical protein C8Q75DRAFT_806139 [Abortiporus biennis]|nr:hypothetical protein C8Q75DRAFT_806139 [Abortiporus biennis]